MSSGTGDLVGNRRMRRLKDLNTALTGSKEKPLTVFYDFYAFLLKKDIVVSQVMQPQPPALVMVSLKERQWLLETSQAIALCIPDEPLLPASTNLDHESNREVIYICSETNSKTFFCKMKNYSKKSKWLLYMVFMQQQKTVISSI